MVLQVMEAISKTTSYLQSKGIRSARLDAEILLAHVLKIDRLNLYLQYDRPLNTQETDAYRELIKKRGEHHPVAYLIGEREFLSRVFRVNSHVLIPRPETEFLVEAVTNYCRGGETIVDVGTGSGIIAINLALDVANSQVMGIDISAKALTLAQENAKLHNIHVDFRQGDLLQPVQAKVQVIVSNPPYISKQELGKLEPQVGNFEPIEALDGGTDGLDYYRRLLAESQEKLAPKGLLALEIGFGQAEKICQLAQPPWRVQSIIPDYQDIPRVLLLTWEG